MRAAHALTFICLLTGCPGALELRRDAGTALDQGPAPGADDQHPGDQRLEFGSIVPAAPDLAAVEPDLPLSAPTSPSGANSGALCNPAAPACPNAGEACVYYSASATTGLCVLSGCTPDTVCPVANPATQLSACFGSTGSQHFCAWLCEYQGKSYACPSPTGFNCVVLNPAQPDVKYCVP